MAGISRPIGAEPVAAMVARQLRGGRADWAGRAFEAALLLTLVVALGILVVLLADVISRASPALAERGLDFFASPLSSRAARAGIAQGLYGSLVLAAFVVVIAFPLGIGAAVYLEEYAADTPLARLINANIRNLAGVPSIVYGLLGLAVFVTFLDLGPTLFVGGLTLAILVLPIVVITTAEALRAVPRSIREAAYGVGATRWEVVRSHVLPYAAPGILTGTILALARAFGETAPLVMVGAIVGTFNARGGLEGIFSDRYTALPTIVYNWAQQFQAEFNALNAAAILTLLGVILLVNLTAIVLRNRYDKKW